MKKRNFILVVMMVSILITGCSKEVMADKKEESSNSITECAKDEKTGEEVSSMSMNGEGNVTSTSTSNSSSYAYTDAGEKTYEFENTNQLSKLVMDEAMGEITLTQSMDHKITAIFEYELGTQTQNELDQLKKYMELEYNMNNEVGKIYRKDDVEGKSLSETMSKISDCKKVYMHITVNIPENIEVIDTSLTSGTLSVKDLKAQFNANVVSGEISFQNVTLEKKNAIFCTSGTIELNPCIVNGDLNVELTSGTMITNFSEIQKKDAKIELHTITGSIECMLPEKIEQLFSMNCNVLTGFVEMNTNHNAIEYITNQSDYVEAEIANGSEVIVKSSVGFVQVR